MRKLNVRSLPIKSYKRNPAASMFRKSILFSQVCMLRRLYKLLDNMETQRTKHKDPGHTTLSFPTRLPTSLSSKPLRSLSSYAGKKDNRTEDSLSSTTGSSTLALVSQRFLRMAFHSSSTIWHSWIQASTAWQWNQETKMGSAYRQPLWLFTFLSHWNHLTHL
jgi:hypothetical protein